LVVGKRLYTATAGDSRIYLLRGKQIFQLNRDHTWIQEAIELGTLPPATAHLHPNAHVIRRYLGSPHGIQADTRLYLHGNESDEQAEANQGLPLQAGDRLVICSDGLTDLVAAHEILDITRKRPLEQALERLVQLANQRGGHDNITIVALQVGKTSSRLVQWLVASTLLALVALALVSSLLLFDFFGGEALLGQILPRRTASSTPVMQLEETLASPLYPPTELPLAPDVRATLPLAPSSTPLPSLQPTATFTPWPTNTPEP
jgi:hypothetical protein